MVIFLLAAACALVSEADLAARMDLDRDGVQRPEDCDDRDVGSGARSDWYADVDGDGFGAGEPTLGCLAGEGYSPRGDDCDDTDPTVGPSLWYRDADGDGYGELATEVSACVQPADLIRNHTDCDDADAEISPAAADTDDDGRDDNCDGEDGLTTRLGNEMISVAAGTFTMGGGVADLDDGYSDHAVTLTRAFWLGRTEVTQAEWAAWLGNPDPTPSNRTNCDRCPVEQVSWIQIALYANELSDREALTPCYDTDGGELAAEFVDDPASCPGYRLPTEAEWEYAARAGEDTVYAGSDVVGDVAWTLENQRGGTERTRLLRANGWGFFDMSGNVLEYANDWSDAGYGGYADGAPQTDPPGPGTGFIRVIRGGAFAIDESFAHISARAAQAPNYGNLAVGFRLARSMDP